MEPFRYHVFICDQRKPEGIPCCAERGSAATIDALRKEVTARGLTDEVQITLCGSLGLCERGPNLVVYPEGIWYSGVLPDDLNQMLRGYMESRAVLTALELDIFTAVGAGSTGGEVARKVSTHPRATEMLLNALAAMGLLVKQRGLFRNTATTARYFAEGSKDNARPGLLHIANIWHRWSTLTECVRAGTALPQPLMAEHSDEWTEAFIAAMHHNARERAPLVVQAIGTRGVERLLDVGGGSAAYSIAFVQTSERLHATVLDLPNVLPIAQRHINEAGFCCRPTKKQPCCSYSGRA